VVRLTYAEQSEKPRLEHFEFLREHEYKSPQVADQPCVYALVSLVSRDQYFWHSWQESLQAELDKISGQSIFVDVDDLVGRSVRRVDLDHLVSQSHGLVVGMLAGHFYVAEQQGLFPFKEPTIVRKQHSVRYLRSFYFFNYNRFHRFVLNLG